MQSNSGESRYLSKIKKGWYRAKHSCTVLFILLRGDKLEINVFIHASIKLDGDIKVYIDPYQIKDNLKDADYIFITHDHYDHYDEESIQKLLKESTVLVVPKQLETKATKLTDKVFMVEPEKTYKLDGLTFETIKSYNIGKSYHPESSGNVGYKLIINGISYYIMGDTDRTKETDAVRADVCFVPIGGTFTMDVDEAAEYINFIKPKKAIPIHYGSLVGDKTLADKFKNKINKEIEVEILI